MRVGPDPGLADTVDHGQEGTLRFHGETLGHDGPAGRANPDKHDGRGPGALRIFALVQHSGEGGYGEPSETGYRLHRGPAIAGIEVVAHRIDPRGQRFPLISCFRFHFGQSGKGQRKRKQRSDPTGAPPQALTHVSNFSSGRGARKVWGRAHGDRVEGGVPRVALRTIRCPP